MNSIKPVCRVLIYVMLPSSIHLLSAGLTGEREAYKIPLPNLSIGYDKETHDFERVRISFEGEDDHAYITRLNDTYIKMTRNGREKTIYPESYARAHNLTEFEVEQLDKIVKALISTLKDFESNLQKKKWGKCLYLDGFFPKFINSFYFLYSAARNSMNVLPSEALPTDKHFDPSLRSPKSDKRIAWWKKHPEHRLKLRIACKELIYQLEKWQKKELRNRRRDIDVSYGDDMEESLTIFVKFYFNLQTVGRR
ncbi:MAG: hypothetical protein GF398_11320 [Chitinivibrionales bacterium]|nr:hypothetical protein [Chitinivibrionales bacterium]